jgi:hypothetical protein
LLTLVRWWRLEAQQVRGKNICHERELMRRKFSAQNIETCVGKARGISQSGFRSGRRKAG